MREQVVRGEVPAGQLPPVGAYLDAVRARAAGKGTPPGARAICAGADCEFDGLLHSRLRERAGAADGAHSAAGQAA
jgi:hypothetical protein